MTTETETSGSGLRARLFIDYLPGRKISESVKLMYPNGNCPVDEIAIFTTDRTKKPIVLKWTKKNGDDPENDNYLLETFHTRTNHEDKRDIFALDLVQNQIKLSNLFSKSVLVIDGGPGTGKSTTTLQRLKQFFSSDFFDENELKLEPNIDPIQKKFIIDNKDKIKDLLKEDSWLYITPTIQLSNFLKGDLIRAGFEKADSHACVWNNYCARIFSESYRFPAVIGIPKKCSGAFNEEPFVVLKKLNECLWKHVLDDYNGQFEKGLKDSSTYLDLSKESAKNEDDFINKIKFIDELESSITESIQKSKAFDVNLANAKLPILRWFKLANKPVLEKMFFIHQVKNLSGIEATLEDDITTMANNVLEYSYFKSILGASKNAFDWHVKNKTGFHFESALFNEYINNNDKGNYADYSKEIESVEKDIQSVLLWYSDQLKTNANLSDNNRKRYQNILKTKLFSVNDECIDEKEKNAFESYLSTLLSNIAKRCLKTDSCGNISCVEVFKNADCDPKMLFNDLIKEKTALQKILGTLDSSFWIPKIYNEYMLNAYKELRPTYGFTNSGKDGTPILSQQEKAFWIFANNVLSKDLLNEKYFGDYVNTYRNQALGLNGFLTERKVLINVDEATDYTAMDYAAIFSLAHEKYSTITLCGDTMQAFNSKGIRDWNMLKPSLGTLKLDIRELKISYRQTETLLNMARSIYKRIKGIDPGYTPIVANEGDEPKPLLFRSDDDEEKKIWILESILKIQKRKEGILPAVAIFYPSDDMNVVNKFASNLNEMTGGMFAITSCEKIADSKVVVYPISKVKGLEFESAFFYDIDKMGDSEMQHCYLYVGLSRSTSFLGATSSIAWNKETSAGLSEDFTDASQSNW